MSYAEREWTTIDKANWGEGAWSHEADKYQWVDEATDLDCLIVRNHWGALCGYVGLPPAHPLHGLGYMDLDRLGAEPEVHGGLTFASACDEDAAEGKGICHIPEPGRPADVWWLGFDCGHAWDLAPGMRAHERDLGLPPMPTMPGPGETYRDVTFVRAECASLARQLKHMQGNPNQ